MGKRSSSFVVSDNSSGDERPAKSSKKAKKEVKKGSSSKNGTNVDSEGNAFWDVGVLFYDPGTSVFTHIHSYIYPKQLTRSP